MASLDKDSVEYRLIQEDPGCKSSFVTPGQNTSGPWRVEPTGWRPWDDFNYSTLKRIFRKELETKFIGSQAAEPLDMTRTIFNERSLDGYIHPRIIEVVNDAIRSVQGEEPNHIGDGARLVANNKGKDKKDMRKDSESKANSHLRPDWSMIPYASPEKGLSKLSNLMVGDTKLNAKWYPDMASKTTDDQIKNKKSTAEQEWGKVLSQVTTYMADNNCRYGFIITDAHLVVLRLSLSGNPAPDQYADPEYCDIPWGGEDKAEAGAGLTPKLALFFLSLLASCKRRTHIRSEYEDMNLWNKPDPRFYTNIYTGRTKKELEAGDEEKPMSRDVFQDDKEENDEEDFAAQFQRQLTIR
ncbi:hypothetical protein PG984_015664 [Apiospora sp. TS-2023a]